MSGYTKVGSIYLPDEHLLSNIFEFYKEYVNRDITYALQDVKRDQKLFDTMARSIFWCVKQEYQSVILSSRFLLFQTLDPHILLPSTKEMFLAQRSITLNTNRGSDENPEKLEIDIIERLSNFFYSLQHEATKQVGHMFAPAMIENNDGSIREDRIHANVNAISLATGLSVLEILEPGSEEEGHDYARMLMAINADALRILIFNLGLTDFDEIKKIPSYFDAVDNENALDMFAVCYGDMPWFLEELSRICGKAVLTDFHLIKPYREDVKDFAWTLGKGGLTTIGIESIQDLLDRMHIYKHIGVLNEQCLRNLKKLFHKDTMRELGEALKDKNILDEIYKIKELLFLTPDHLFANLEKIYEISNTGLINIKQISKNNNEVISILTKCSLPLRSINQYKLVSGYARRVGVQQENLWYDLCTLNNHNLDYKIIVDLLQNQLYPTPHIIKCIETGETTIEQLLAMRDTYKETKTFNINDRLHQDLEYFTYSTTSKKMGWSTQQIGSYNIYAEKVEILALYGNRQSNYYDQQEIRQAAKESLHTKHILEDLMIQRNNAVFITPNRSYGKVITAPLGNEIQGQQFQPLKIGSTECHGMYIYAKVDLLSREQIKTLLQGNTDWYVLDGTAGESFPDSNIGFKTYMCAINDAIDACRNEDKQSAQGNNYGESDYERLTSYIISIIKRCKINPQAIKKYKMKYISPNSQMKLKTRGKDGIPLQENKVIDPRYNYLFYIDPVVRGTKHQGKLDDTPAVSGITLSYDDSGLHCIYKDLQETMQEEMSKINLHENNAYYMFEEAPSI